MQFIHEAVAAPKKTSRTGEPTWTTQAEIEAIRAHLRRSKCDEEEKLGKLSLETGHSVAALAELDPLERIQLSCQASIER